MRRRASSASRRGERPTRLSRLASGRRSRWMAFEKHKGAAGKKKQGRVRNNACCLSEIRINLREIAQGEDGQQVGQIRKGEDCQEAQQGRADTATVAKGPLAIQQEAQGQADGVAGGVGGQVGQTEECLGGEDDAQSDSGVQDSDYDEPRELQWYGRRRFHLTSNT